ncbi:LysR family transcriptional regulator [Mycobacterium kubicae]|uniref:Probable hydrogen peroxide-inducible genes activator n=1 Tax=Mycobacterium kubicae TaxID=120959 RepID=A0AAX1J9T0_9MYCO|nr:LysR family transcriptional regulator [Mycobacterium kubicae]MCV7093837.1 LysR family transcriptional regulator [Mycobacterium kubicae]OBF19151.1 LysR family transcriptional regulator [Mycobacterium kubicae]OBK55957.1 LysR family transcriptional regulator [Mycobacterium kubicae]ORW00697.1 LysR family transcriptional regulator [Mycobacterium kubicae]QNI05037.1 LysR family transcriptional regulator [Mycobacterium kubicae]
MNLQQIRYVLAVAESRSFTRAADNMFVVQSALSQQVRKLEEELGLQIFNRTTRSVSLTPAGESLLPLLRQVVGGLDQIVVSAQALRGAVTGRLTVGMMEIPSESLDVAALMATFHTRYPDVTVTLRSGGSDLLVQATRDRKLDVAVVGSNVARSADRLSFDHLFSEALVAVLPIRHPLAAGPAVSLDALADYPFIDFPPGYGLRHETDRGFGEVRRRVAFEVTRVDEVVHFVCQDLGVALLPESVARSRAEVGSALVLLPVRGAVLRREVHLVAPHAELRSAATQAFIECVHEHITDRAGTEPPSGRAAGKVVR